MLTRVIRIFGSHSGQFLNYKPTWYVSNRPDSTWAEVQTRGRTGIHLYLSLFYIKIEEKSCSLQLFFFEKKIPDWNVIKKKIPVQAFSYWFCKIFCKEFFVEHLLATAPSYLRYPTPTVWKLNIKTWRVNFKGCYLHAHTGFKILSKGNAFI